MKHKPDFDRVKKYWKAFWEKELLDRPPVVVTAPKDPKDPPVFDGSAVPCYRAVLSGDYDAYLDSFATAAEKTFYGGEAVPFLNASLGPDQYAGFFGSPIEAKEGYITTWSKPCVSDLTAFDPVPDRSEGSYFARLMDFMAYAADYAKGEFLVAQLDYHSNMDALSALRGPENLCFDIMDTPEEVHRVLDRLDSYYPELFEAAYRAGKMAELGCIGWAPTYCEERFAVIQCDFSIFLSPDQAREFVIPSVRREAACLDRCVYHFDGVGALGHLDDILAIPEIDCIQWVPGEGKPRTVEWLDLLRKIQDAGKSVWIYDWSPEEIKAHAKELKPNLVCFSVGAASPEEAEDLLESLKCGFNQ